MCYFETLCVLAKNRQVEWRTIERFLIVVCRIVLSLDQYLDLFGLPIPNWYLSWLLSEDKNIVSPNHTMDHPKRDDGAIAIAILVGTLVVALFVAINVLRKRNTSTRWN